MQIQLEQLFNKHKNMPCVIVGGSQTMMDFNYKKFKGIIISVGSSILRIHNRFEPHYLVGSNNEFPVIEISHHLNFLNKLNKNIIWVMSDTGCYNTLFTENKKIWDHKLKINYVKYDDRHFENKKCSPEQRCCKYLKLYPNRQTLYEILFSFCKKKNPIKKNGATSAEYALGLSLILGCKPIFIQGVDIPTKYYHGKQIGKKYYGYKSIYADNFEDKTMRFLKKKYFFYYLKRLDFMPYLKSFYNKLRIGRHNSFFSLNNFSETLSNFLQLGKLAKSKKVKIFVLSKKSNLLKISYFKFLNSSSVKEKYPSYFFKK